MVALPLGECRIDRIKLGLSRGAFALLVAKDIGSSPGGRAEHRACSRLGHGVLLSE